MLSEEFEKLVLNIARLNEDQETVVPPLPDDGPVENEESVTPADPREAIRETIAPQVEVAQSVITSVSSAFADKCDDEKRYKQVKSQIKNWEKTLRGACQQIVAVVNQKGFTPDPTNSSPIAFSTISDSSSRDVSVLDLAAAIITFYNSLGA